MDSGLIERSLRSQAPDTAASPPPREPLPRHGPFLPRASLFPRAPEATSLLPRACLVDVQRPAPAGTPVEPSHCRLGLGAVWHLHKTKAPRAAGCPVHEDHDVPDLPIGLKQLAQLGVRGRIREIAHKNTHGISPYGGSCRDGSGTPYRPLSTRLEHAGAPRLLQPLLKRATIDGFLLPGLAIAGAVDVAVEQELAQVRQGQRVVLRRGLRNALDVHREGLRARRRCGSSRPPAAFLQRPPAAPAAAPPRRQGVALLRRIISPATLPRRSPRQMPQIGI